MSVPNREAADRVNILLPFGGELTERMLRQPATSQWAAEEIAAVRTAATEQERADFTSPEIEDSRVQSILRVLVGNQAMRGAMGIADTEGSDTETLNNVAYVTSSDLNYIGPSAGMALVIPEIGVISVPTPAEGARGAQMVRDTLTAGGVGDHQVEAAVPVYAAVGLFDDGNEANGLGYAADAYPVEDEDERWFEAELTIGAAAETIPWGVARVNAPRAWARGFFGQGIRVAVVDTGVGPHPDLPPPAASATFVPGTNSADDDQGHGTHVAGTILARRNGLGVIGVAPRAQLLRAKVLDRTGRGSDTQVAAGIVWAVNNGARIINLSLGSTAASTVIARALVFARSRGVTICAAAGNDSTPTFCAPLIFPARHPLCIAVAATDRNNRKATFSCCGPGLDLAAPGVDILSTVRPSGYSTKSGTSMATPHVAGLAAIVLSKRPTLGVAALQAILERSAIPLGPLNQFGHGLVQADRAIAIAVTEDLPMDEPAAIGPGAGGSGVGRPVAAGASRGGRQR